MIVVLHYTLLSARVSGGHLRATGATAAQVVGLFNNRPVCLCVLPVRPLSVELLFGNQPLSADRRYDIQCQAVGSRPPAKITWWINGTQVDSTNVTVSNSVVLDCSKEKKGGRGLRGRSRTSLLAINEKSKYWPAVELLFMALLSLSPRARVLRSRPMGT